MVAALSVLGAVAAASRRMSPTDSGAVDAGYGLALGAAVTYYSRLCPWWLLAAIAAAGAALAPTFILAVAAMLAGLLPATSSRRTTFAQAGRTMAALALMWTFTQLRNLRFQGSTALLGGSAFGIIVIVGLTRSGGGTGAKLSGLVWQWRSSPPSP